MANNADQKSDRLVGSSEEEPRCAGAPQDQSDRRARRFGDHIGYGREGEAPGPDRRSKIVINLSRAGFRRANGRRPLREQRQNKDESQ